MGGRARGGGIGGIPRIQLKAASILTSESGNGKDGSIPAPSSGGVESWWR